MPYLYLTILVVLIDQASKLLVQAKMGPMQSISVIDGWFSLTYVTNYGAAFGILQSQTLLLIGITLGVIIMVWINRKKMSEYPSLLQIGLAIALGGAVGNLIDRIRLGYVIDFFDLQVWPVFNVADMAIIAGVCLIIAGMLLKDFRDKKLKKTGSNSQYLEGTISGEEKL